MKNMAWMIPAVVFGALLACPRAARADKAQKPDAVEGKCNEGGGVFFPPSKGHSYACLYPDGSGVVCGGAKKGCDSWPASTPARKRPRRAQALVLPEKVQAK